MNRPWIAILALISCLSGFVLGRISAPEPPTVTVPGGNAYENMMVSWMRISRIEGIPRRREKFENFCHNYPIIESADIEDPDERALLWKALTRCISEEEVEIDDGFQFRPAWGIEFWNLDHGSALLYSPAQGIAVVKFGERVGYHVIQSFPTEVVSSITELGSGN